MKSSSAQIAVLVLALTSIFLASSSCSTPSHEADEAPNGMVRETVTLPDGSRVGVVANRMTATAKIESINAATRMVVLRRDDGLSKSLVCGPEIRNFHRLKVGDMVKVTVAEELAVVLSKDALPGAATESSAIERAKEGARPGGRLVSTSAFTARVTAIDPPRRLVTLRMVDGQSKTVRVDPQISLVNVHPGDDVGVRLTQEVVVTVTEP